MNIWYFSCASVQNNTLGVRQWSMSTEELMLKTCLFFTFSTVRTLNSVYTCIGKSDLILSSTIQISCHEGNARKHCNDRTFSFKIYRYIQKYLPFFNNLNVYNLICYLNLIHDIACLCWLRAVINCRWFSVDCSFKRKSNI